MNTAGEAGDRASCPDSRTPPNLVLGASLLLPFVDTGGFGGGDALVLGAVGAWRGWQFVLWTAWWAALAGAFSVRDSGPLLPLFTQALRSRIPRRWKWQSPPSQLAYPPLYLSDDASPSGRLVRFLRAAHEPEEEAMGKVYLSLSMSLDGFITGHNPRPEDRRRRLALYVLCLGCS
jgi:hypothetical protein